MGLLDELGDELPRADVVGEDLAVASAQKTLGIKAAASTDAQCDELEAVFYWSACKEVPIAGMPHRRGKAS